MQPDPEPVATPIVGTVDPPPTGAPGGSNQTLSMLLIAFGSILMVFTIARILGKVKRRARTPVEGPQQVIERHRESMSAARDPLDGAMADANELASRLARLIDTKAARLDVLIQQADERIARLEAMGNGSTERPPPGVPLSRPRERVEIGSLEREVFELADEGRGSEQIAHRVGRSVGEVELILALRR